MQDILSRTWAVQEHISTLKPSKSAYLKVLSLDYKEKQLPLHSGFSKQSKWEEKLMKQSNVQKGNCTTV